MIRTWLIAVTALIFLSGCGKDIEEYNKPAEYWYEKMVTAVSNGNLEKADSYFSSLQSEHISSPFLSEATMIMAQAHMAHEEYLLSEHFLDEYIRRYATPEGREYAEFLKIKAKFLALPNPGRDQGLIDDTLNNVNTFKTNYPNSTYMPLVHSMETQLQLARGVLNEQIAELYERLYKPKAAASYRSIAPVTWIESKDIVYANVPWYREMFEGDGTSSWYAFMIPKTRSVISMDDNESVEAVNTVSTNEAASTEKTKVQDNGSWYDFMIPNFEKKDLDAAPKAQDNSSWYDFMIPNFEKKDTGTAPKAQESSSWYNSWIPHF